MLVTIERQKLLSFQITTYITKLFHVLKDRKIKFPGLSAFDVYHFNNEE